MAQFRLAGSWRIAVACSREGMAMSTFSSGSGFTPPWVVALLVVALLASGLVLLRLAADSGSVGVPGAKAGDLVIHPCDYATEDSSQAADCDALVVPHNRADPQSRLIALPVTRLPGQSDQPAEPVPHLEGGPRITKAAVMALAQGWVCV
jgi:hypothetical protein